MIVRMPLESDNRSKARHRKSTCSGCRRRKSKCDGKTPKCTTCIAYKDECHYDKPPSLAYVRSLEDEISELRSQLRLVKNQVWAQKNEDARHAASPKSDTVDSHQSGSANSLAHRNRPVKWEGDISVDDHGGVSFHNSTSGLHEPPPHPVAMTQILAPVKPSTPQEEQLTKQGLVMNADQQRQLEPYAIAHSAVRINVPKEVSSELLNYHWCWMHPLFLFVYRPAFTKAMGMVDYNSSDAQDPTYFSDTLLRVIHAHCARMLNHDVCQHHYQTAANINSPMATTFSAQEFMEKMTEEARFGLGMDILKPSTIPTIQALLQQSAREVVFGRSSQAWTFAGVAFRMALDMGIHLPTDKLQSFIKTLSAEDVEIRKRLFWSCYTWDKILSLYLGRMPGFTHPATDDVPMTFMDDYSDSDLWAPYYGETPRPDHAQAPNYPPCPGYVVMCFRQLCKLCIILNDLMQHIYSPEAAARRDDEENSAEAKAANEEPFIRIFGDLRDWLVALPPHLRINPDQMPPLAPPVHIMSLNLLYHTTLILLHRPVLLGVRDLSQPGPFRSYNACLQATAAIHDLLLLQSNTFGLSHVSYLNAYSAYIAATIAVLRFDREYKPGEDTTMVSKQTGLTLLLDVLTRSSTSMPALHRSEAIIRKRMRAVLDRYIQSQSQPSSHQQSQVMTPLMPFTMPTSQEMSLAAPTAFQTISTSHQQNHQIPHYASSVSYAQTDRSQSFIAPGMQWQQSDMRSSSYTPPNGTSGSASVLMDDFLPAFPGQQFPVVGGSGEHGFGDERGMGDVLNGLGNIGAKMGRGLMGYNLDPHPRINMVWNHDGGGGLEGMDI